MYKYKENIIKDLNSEKIEDDIINKLISFIDEGKNIEELKEIDYFIENILYIQGGKKFHFNIVE